MRVTRIPGDAHDIGDSPRRVWLNDREIHDWITADEFRRCVVTPEGALHGAVLIERLSVAGESVVEPAPMVDIGLSGISVAVPVEPNPEPAAAPKPMALKVPTPKHSRRRK